MAAAAAKEACPTEAEKHAALLDPAGEAMAREAPGAFNVTFATSKGNFRVEVRREWAPRGADRFYNLVRHGFFDSTRFYRVSARRRARGRGGRD